MTETPVWAPGLPPFRFGGTGVPARGVKPPSNNFLSAHFWTPAESADICKDLTKATNTQPLAGQTQKARKNDSTLDLVPLFPGRSSTYIYIYICVCVCVCVSAPRQVGGDVPRRASRWSPAAPACGASATRALQLGFPRRSHKRAGPRPVPVPPNTPCMELKYMQYC